MGYGLVGVALSLALPALAADLPTHKGDPVAPVIVPVVYDWSGCYVGVNGGGLWVNKNWTSADAINLGQQKSSMTATGGMIGGQAGCNYQIKSWVLGIQVDEDATNAKGSGYNPINFTQDQAKITSLGTLSLRGGYAWDRFLAYLRGGLAWETDRYRQMGAGVPGNVALGVLFSNASETRFGGLIALGGEYAITDNITAFIEYEYMDFGKRSVAFTTNANATQNNYIRESKNVVRVGLNWKFSLGAAPAAVVAKY